MNYSAYFIRRSYIWRYTQPQMLKNLWFPAKGVYNSQFHDGVADAEMEKKDNTFNYLNAKLTESIYTTK